MMNPCSIIFNSYISVVNNKARLVFMHKGRPLVNKWDKEQVLVTRTSKFRTAIQTLCLIVIWPSNPDFTKRIELLIQTYNERPQLVQCVHWGGLPGAPLSCIFFFLFVILFFVHKTLSSTNKQVRRKPLIWFLKTAWQKAFNKKIEIS